MAGLRPVDYRVLIIGGGGFLGDAVVTGVLEQGWQPIVADVSPSQSRQGVPFLRINITDKTSVAEVFRSVHRDHGPIAAVVNASYPRNTAYGKPFEEVELESFNENVAMHLGGYFLVCQVAAEYFRGQGGGTIVQFSSIYGVVAPRFEIYEGTAMTMPVEYAAIKAGIIGLTRYVARYYAGNGIRINSVSPGGIRRDQPAEFQAAYDRYGIDKGMLDREDVVGTVVFLLGPQSRWINGQNIVVDDGWTL